MKHTFVECLFGGQLISTIICEECKYVSTDDRLCDSERGGGGSDLDCSV